MVLIALYEVPHLPKQRYGIELQRGFDSIRIFCYDGAAQGTMFYYPIAWGARQGSRRYYPRVGSGASLKKKFGVELELF
ncbi:hypothetical protein NG796_24395 [Laspinema sp. A4]|uniref:hypothetical protein n=1 Tax=Laspinema sp. D2d TaxID=2953686 RepID=UPI0021BB84F6|nr:hypothetical protein [Laspinema sp. D2d]MCT7986415.1 hypothetical protein [Laspinema sp. D2d]